MSANSAPASVPPLNSIAKLYSITKLYSIVKLYDGGIMAPYAAIFHIINWYVLALFGQYIIRNHLFLIVLLIYS